MSKDEFKKRTDAKIKDWHDLIDENAAAHLVVDELGRGKIEFTKISDVKDGVVNVSARVDSVGEPREFTTKRGSGRVLNVSISDDSGKCRLALWDDDIELIESLGIREGRRVKIVNGYAKSSRYGLDVRKGKWGTIEVED